MPRSEPRLFDCFLFNDELDLLELRLEETEAVVDRWVIVECPMNWQQKAKPLFFDENKARFAKWLDRIEHCILREHPIGPYPVIEWFQRRALEMGWKMAGAEPGDLVMVSDADEIPSGSLLAALKVDLPASPVVLQQWLFYYSVDCLQRQAWNGPIIFELEDREYDVQRVRDMRNKLPVATPGGWHFSWLGPLDKIQYKLGCHTVAEDSGGLLAPPDADDVAFLTRCLNHGADLFGRKDEYAHKRFVTLDPGNLHPKGIVRWLARHPEYARRVEVA